MPSNHDNNSSDLSGSKGRDVIELSILNSRILLEIFGEYVKTLLNTASNDKSVLLIARQYSFARDELPSGRSPLDDYFEKFIGTSFFTFLSKL